MSGVWRFSGLRQLILLCSASLLVGTADGDCLFEEYCSGTDTVEVHKNEIASLSCNSSTISVFYEAPPLVESGLANLRAYNLECSHPNQSNETVIIDLTCDKSRERIDRRDLSPQTVTINVSAEGLPPGSRCSVKGCYDEYVLNIYTFNDSCEIGRDCEWGEWSEWSECSSECGRETQVRHRVKAVLAEWTGRECEGSFNESRDCTTKECTDAPTISEVTPTSTEVPTQTATKGNCNDTLQCPQHAKCVDTVHGPSCICLSGYHGNGSTCVVSYSLAGVAVATTLLVIMVTVSVLGVAFCYLSGRKRRGLDHKRLEKMMGTFDPNFTPHLSTNLRKFVATSEISVFDTLWLHSPRPGENEYVTLDELGIHIHNNHHMRYSDSESSIEMRIAELADGDEDTVRVSPTSRKANRRRAGRPVHSHHSDDTDSRSTYSLDSHTVQRMFRLGDSFQNTNYKSEDETSDEEDARSLESEPKDFVEDVLRIDIRGFSDVEEGEGPYMAVRGDSEHCDEDEHTAMEQRDFVEGALKIDIDGLEDSDQESVREYVNVERVCFTLPESGADEMEPLPPSPIQAKHHHLSLLVLNQREFEESADSLSDSSPLSSSTPSLFIS